jgi:hypothetical protein
MGFLVLLVLDLVKPVKYGVFIFKVMSQFTLHLPSMKGRCQEMMAT